MGIREARKSGKNIQAKYKAYDVGQDGWHVGRHSRDQSGIWRDQHGLDLTLSTVEEVGFYPPVLQLSILRLRVLWESEGRCLGERLEDVQNQQRRSNHFWGQFSDERRDDEVKKPLVNGRPCEAHYLYFLQGIINFTLKHYHNCWI